MRRVVLALFGVVACGRVSFDPLADASYEADTSSDVPNRVFLTAMQTAGDFGGVANADQVCATEAQAAGLTGTFIAFVFDSTANPRSRLQGSRGWIRMDGRPIGQTIEAMLDSYQVFYPLNELVDGSPLVSTQTWTGLDRNGQPGETCLDWTTSSAAQSGQGNAVLNGTFAGGNPASCDTPRHFLCFEIGHVADVAPSPTAGRFVFVSVAKRTTALSVGAADMVCSDEARASGLPGTYKAVLATSTTPVTSRFTVDARPWVRIDGTEVAAANELFVGVAPLESFPNQHANGAYHIDKFWTGIKTSPDAPSSMADTCLDWSTVAASSSAPFGLPVTANRASLWASGTAGCDAGYQFLCAQE